MVTHPHANHDHCSLTPAAFGPWPPPNLFPHILQVRLEEEGQKAVLGNHNFHWLGQSPPPTFRLLQLWLAKYPQQFLCSWHISHHFSINFKYCSHSEDADRTFLRNVGTFSNQTIYKRKEDYHLTKNPRGSPKTYTNKHVCNAFAGDTSWCTQQCDKNEVCSPPNGSLKGHRWVRYWRQKLTTYVSQYRSGHV